MGFNSAFKVLKLLKNRERAFKQFKWPRPQCVKKCQLWHSYFLNQALILSNETHFYSLYFQLVQKHCHFSTFIYRCMEAAICRWNMKDAKRINPEQLKVSSKNF